MIEVRNLSFAYKKKNVLEDISFATGEGQLIAVLGSNGAGKSTMFKCILGLLNKYKGEIYLNGRNIKDVGRKEMASYVAYIPQSETPAFNYTVFDSVLMGTTGTISMLGSPKKEQLDRTHEVIERLGIGYIQYRGINEISGGERQLALLARAMAQKARLLIMDEPTANLDYGNQQYVLDAVKKMADDGYTILLSTHNPEHALQYATHILTLKDHRIIADGPAGELLDEDLIENIYGLKVRIIETNVDGRSIKSCIPVAQGKGPARSYEEKM